jgi:hypothetical protein
MKVRVDATVDVDAYDVLNEMSIDELADILADRRLHAKKSGKSQRTVDPTDVLIESIDHNAMETAIWHWNNGRTSDALLYLEKSLGRPWNGLFDLVQSRAAA